MLEDLLTLSFDANFWKIFSRATNCGYQFEVYKFELKMNSLPINYAGLLNFKEAKIKFKFGEKPSIIQTNITTVAMFASGTFESISTEYKKVCVNGGLVWTSNINTCAGYSLTNAPKFTLMQNPPTQSQMVFWKTSKLDVLNTDLRACTAAD